MVNESVPTAPARDSKPGGVALLIIDMINCFDFKDAARLRQNAVAIAPRICRLRREMCEIGAPTIYVNDNFGEWHSEKSKLIEKARAKTPEILNLLAPGDDDYFIIKPQFSGFYATNLPLLLPKLGVSRLILSGVAADICVLFTAADAHMRDYALWVPQDAVAAVHEVQTARALQIMRDNLEAEIAGTDRLDVRLWMDALDAEARR